MELHHLRHFVAVADALHFGRAARKLGMAQPPLSQSIRRLEASLGLQLLDRSRRHVSVTPAGKALYDEARRLLAQVELAEQLTRRAAKVGVRRLRLGFTPLAMYGEIPRALTAFRERWPGVEIILQEGSMRSQVEGLQRGHLDVGVWTHYGAGVPGLEMESIGRRYFGAVVPSDCPLARQRRLKLADLRDYPWVMHDPALNQNVHQAILSACRAAGFQPVVAQYANQSYAMLNLIACGIGVTLISRSPQVLTMKGITWIPVDDLPEGLFTDMCLAWSPQAVSPALTSFLSLAREISAKV